MTLPAAPSSSPLRSQVTKGLHWTGGSQALQQIFNLGSSVIMARLLSPQDFGLLAMTSVFTGVATFVLDLGLSAAIVQRKDLSTQQITSVFWLNIAMGTGLMLLGLGVSGPIADFYRTPLVQPILLLMSSNFLIISLSRTQASLLLRRMDYRALSLRTLFSTVVGIVAGILLAWWGFGVWSLVGRILVTSVAEGIILWSVSGWRPTYSFSWPAVKDLVGFGNSVLVSDFLRYISRNADNLLIGRYVGATSLGFYALSYNLMMVPVRRFTQVLAQVMFPALAHLQTDLKRLRNGWLRSVQLTTAIICPLIVGVIVLAYPFVEVVYGSKWLPAAQLLQILAISGLFQSLGQINQTVLKAMGKVKLNMQLTMIAATLALIAFLVGLPYGTVGVAICFTIANIFSEGLFVWKTLYQVNCSLGIYLRNLRGVFVASLGLGIVLKIMIISSIPVTASGLLIISIPLGIISYLLFLYWADQSLSKELWHMVTRQRQGAEVNLSTK